ncbi:hypothetical protein, conserved [Trypanosoma brucei gambiense DAL972]|uniref:Uncharacterized protein n=2 Tax=Trypanosoma brucei TaxID=5691 RepID=D0A376_TRYB9|nr:hypothetical protein, conserved [Trypanosoma brucei gambiense DAL972]RHW68622.1 hypothetical protein DPX39_100072200 [Trypanosoma brucei equiperdum]CBH15720.1 hypothetical protein, conserved [Trypanosoma brucei gambiense DAL972]|eukprot:XP_011777984.1 hypothetical protein, conserved [Trypanosoma brucei gambiense DAL972]
MPHCPRSPLRTHTAPSLPHEQPGSYTATVTLHGERRVADAYASEVCWGGQTGTRWGNTHRGVEQVDVWKTALCPQAAFQRRALSLLGEGHTGTRHGLLKEPHLRCCDAGETARPTRHIERHRSPTTVGGDAVQQLGTTLCHSSYCRVPSVNPPATAYERALAKHGKRLLAAVQREQRRKLEEQRNRQVLERRKALYERYTKWNRQSTHRNGSEQTPAAASRCEEVEARQHSALTVTIGASETVGSSPSSLPGGGALETTLQATKHLLLEHTTEVVGCSTAPFNEPVGGKHNQMPRNTMYPKELQEPQNHNLAECECSTSFMAYLAGRLSPRRRCGGSRFNPGSGGRGDFIHVCWPHCFTPPRPLPCRQVPHEWGRNLVASLATCGDADGEGLRWGLPSPLSCVLPDDIHQTSLRRSPRTAEATALSQRYCTSLDGSVNECAGEERHLLTFMRPMDQPRPLLSYHRPKTICEDQGGAYAASACP